MNETLNAYKVYTQHDNTRGKFIVPIDVKASSAFEAAQKRFAQMAGSSRANCSALLVLDEGGSELFDPGEAVVFAVADMPTTTYAPTVTPEPVVV